MIVERGGPSLVAGCGWDAGRVMEDGQNYKLFSILGVFMRLILMQVRPCISCLMFMTLVHTEEALFTFNHGA